MFQAFPLPGITFYDKGQSYNDIFPTYYLGGTFRSHTLLAGEWIENTSKKIVVKAAPQYESPTEVISYKARYSANSHKAPIVNDYALNAYVILNNGVTKKLFKVTDYGATFITNIDVVYSGSSDGVGEPGNHIYESDEKIVQKINDDGSLSSLYNNVEIKSLTFASAPATYTVSQIIRDNDANDKIYVIGSGIFTINADKTGYSDVKMLNAPLVVTNTSQVVYHRYTLGHTITNVDGDDHTITESSKILVMNSLTAYIFHTPNAKGASSTSIPNTFVSSETFSDGVLIPALAPGQVYNGKTVQVNDVFLRHGHNNYLDGLYKITASGYNSTKPASASYVHTTNFALTPSNFVLGGTVDGRTISGGDVFVLTAQSNNNENGIYTFSDQTNAPATRTRYDVIAPHNIELATLSAGDTVENTQQVLTAGSRILLTGQTDPKQNGVYIVPSSGDEKALPERASDLITGGSALGVCIYDRFSDMIYVCANNNSAIVDTDDLSFTGTTGDFVRLTGEQSVAGEKTFSNKIVISDSSASTSRTTGALVVNGGAGFGGNVTAQQFVTVSDATFKTNVSELNDPLRKIKQLNGYTYEWKNDPEQQTQSGLLAQEVQKSDLNHIVHGDDTLSIDYSALIPYLIESIKTLDSKINQLQDLK